MAFEGTLQEFTIRMHGHTLEHPYIEAQQGDTASRKVRIHLKTFDGADFLIPYGATAVLSVDKTDGHKVLNECEIEDSSTIIITLTSQTLACPGKQLSQIYIFTDKGDIKTQKFYIHVPKAVYDQDAIESSDEYGILLELIERIENLGGGGSGATEEQLEQIEQNKNDITQLKSDLDKLSSNIIEPYEDDIPKIFYGSNLPQNKIETVMPFRYISKTQDISGYCETKAQGNSSLSFPKKNQTTKLYVDADCTEKLKVDFKGWGKQNKFVMKANWIDLTHARNVVSARLWADVVKSRTRYDELPELLRTSPNQGAVDGFPIKVYANGIYQGRYTLNIPKDKWTFNMDDDLDTHCILCSENYNSGCFRATAKIDGFDWTDELHDAVPDSIKTRWNEVISFVMTSTNDEFVANLNSYIDVESVIDYYIFALVSCGLDCMGKNQIYITYNGVKWYASMYDMDSTWGLYYNGSNFVSAEYAMQDEYESMVGSREGNLLYLRLEELFMDEIKTRYEILRNGVLSVSHIINRFERFTDITPTDLVAEDYASTTGDGNFTSIPSKTTNNIQQIRKFVVDRLAYSDDYIFHRGMPKVTNHLQYCVINNDSKYVENGGSFVAKITANDGYELSTVTITMGGIDITSTCYSDGNINIISVTGDIDITAICKEIAEYTYTNKVPVSIDTDGSVFNSVGYYNGQELSGSKGTQRAGTNCTVTGFIPVKRGDIIRIKGCAWENSVKNNYVVAYNDNFEHWGTTTSGGSHYYGSANANGNSLIEKNMIVSEESGGVSTITIWDSLSHDNLAYIRVSCKGDGSINVDGANLIVTVNEEIT